MLGKNFCTPKEEKSIPVTEYPFSWAAFIRKPSPAPISKKLPFEAPWPSRA
jgi:hypothetical protein